MKLTYKIMEKMLKVKYVSLPNLIVGNSIVPELLLHLCTPDTIARELSPLLQASPRRDWQISGYRNMQRRLGNSVAAEYAAELIYDSLNPNGDATGQTADAAAKEPERPRPKRRPAQNRARRRCPADGEKNSKPASQD